jgi:small subunit ribosomal protein S3
MADEHQFIEEGLQRTQIDEFFADELARAGYGGMDVAKTPMGTQIVLKAEKPGMVIGKGGKNIRKITTTIEEEFGLEDPQIDVQEVDEPDLNAQIVADRLANALERGWYFRKAGHTTIDRIMDAGALGAEIILSGKVTGQRSRVEKFNRGYIKHNGEPAETIVDSGVATAVMKLGTIGVQVAIIPPGADLPDDFHVEEDADTEPLIEGATGDVEDLVAEAEDAEADADADAPAADAADAAADAAAVPDEEVVEEPAPDADEADDAAGEDAPADDDAAEADAPEAAAAAATAGGGTAAEPEADADEANDEPDDLDASVEAAAADLVDEMEDDA